MNVNKHLSKIVNRIASSKSKILNELEMCLRKTMDEKKKLKTNSFFCVCEIRRKTKIYSKKNNNNKILFGTINVYLYRFIILYCGIFIYFNFLFSVLFLLDSFCSLAHCCSDSLRKKNRNTNMSSKITVQNM